MRRSHLLAAGRTAIFVALIAMGTPAFAGDDWPMDGTNHPSVGWIFAQQSDPNTCDAEIVGACAAVLVSPTVAVTSAGCTEAFSSTSPFTFTAVWLNMNPDDPFDCSTASRVASLHSHPMHDPAASGQKPSPFDIGVLVLAAPSTYTPASLPAEGSQDDYLRGDPFDLVMWAGVTGGTVFDYRRSIAPVALAANSEALSKFRLSANGLDCVSGTEGGGAFLPSSQSLTAITIDGSSQGCRNASLLRLDTAAVRDFLGGFVTLP